MRYPNLMQEMIDWETGEIEPEDELSLFQRLVDSGMAWSLQGTYGRHAARLLKAGAIQPASGDSAVGSVRRQV